VNEAATAEPAQAIEPQRREAWWVRHYTFTGTAVGLVFIWFSMTPSLLPRGPLFQGLVSGLAGAIGYSIGVFAVWLVRFMLSRDSSPPAPRRAWLALIVVYPLIATVIRSFFDASGQNFIALGNYKAIFSTTDIIVALKNNVVWVVLFPFLVTFFGLVFAVLTDYEHFTRISGSIVESRRVQQLDAADTLVYTDTRFCALLFCRHVKEMQKVTQTAPGDISSMPNSSRIRSDVR